MTHDPEISRRIYAALHANDVETFRRLLSDHPEFLRHDDGTDRWMWQAAMDGNLPLLEALISLGVDVNEPKDPPDPDDPDAQVEGPILWAASEGHLDVVRWLLQHGAKINYVVDGKPRSLPLQFAATNGHLAVVKLLVENGADIDGSWNGTNAIRQAEDYGHPQVRDYLLSVRSAN